jgi:hypothetical protein
MDSAKRLHKPSLDSNKKQTPNPNHHIPTGPSEPLPPACPDPIPPTASALPLPRQTVHLSSQTLQKREAAPGAESLERAFLDQVLQKYLHEELSREQRASEGAGGVELLAESLFEVLEIRT